LARGSTIASPGRLDAFSPNSKKIHIDIDPSARSTKTCSPISALWRDAGMSLVDGDVWQGKRRQTRQGGAKAVVEAEIDGWRARNGFAYGKDDTIIKPQYAIERLYALTKDKDDTYITTEVGQHQMWAAQFFHFDEPNRWMTSGGLGTMGYGLPAAIGVQMAHPNALVIDIAGEASVLMTMQEMSDGCAVQSAGQDFHPEQ
jgi:acetolactate synthase I/II/III large subunit